MMRKLGKITNPEQYLRVPKEICPLDNSVKMWNFLMDYGYNENIIIYPAEIKISSLTYPCIYSWIAVDTEKKEIVATFPCFSIDENLIANCKILAIELLAHDCFITWNNVFYTIVFTSTGEAVIKKLNGAWFENDAKNLMKIKFPNLVNPDIYPVELFSVSLGKFICASWAINDAQSEVIYWYPFCWNDIELIKQFDSKDIEMFPLNIGDVTKAGDIVFKICYEKDLGVYIKKTKETLSWQHFYSKEFTKENVNNLLLKSTLVNKERKNKHAKKCKARIISLVPKKE